MAVVKNHFTHTLIPSNGSTISALDYETHTITGLISETSSTSLNYMAPAPSLWLLQDLYKTLIDAGYDVIKNEEEYSLTVLGFKFFVFASFYGSSNFRCSPSAYAIGTENRVGNQDLYLNNDNKNTSTSFEYYFIVRGDDNHVSITIITAKDGLSNEYTFITFAKGQSLIDKKNIFFFSRGLNVITTMSGTSYASGAKLNQYIRKETEPYILLDMIQNPSVNDASGILNNSINNNLGLNTSSKYICCPVVGYFGTVYFPSFIKSNSKLFIRDTYYKIGENIYYCEQGNLYKVG